MKFRFEVFGTRETASSRLRAWKIAHGLEERGHEAQVGECRWEGTEVDVWVFQKKRDFESLKCAQAGGGMVVFDFDDNYLLKDVGTRHEILAFMNAADLVTVGSPALLEEARDLHERVFLFENPIDVLDEDVCKEQCEWHGRLVWFGNRTNLPALDGICEERHITRITSDGDFEWSLETIDEDLTGFDLALLPVTSSEWRSAKNANRLLKCIALGLPALASAAPEHVRVADIIGLPELLLIAEGESWEDRVQAIGREYGRVQREVLNARQRVLEIWGIKPTVDRWLSQIVDVREASDNNMEVGRNGVRSAGCGSTQCESLDVIIVVDGPEQRWRKTLRSVRKHYDAKSMTVIGMGVADEADVGRQGASCYFSSDPFRMYELLGDMVRSGEGNSVLLLRGGAELRPGFALELDKSPDGSHIALFAVQEVERRNEIVSAPQTLQDVLRDTYMPPCVMIPKGVFRNVNVRLSRYGALIPWFGVIWGVHQWNYHVQRVDAPVVMAPRKAMAAQPVERYWELLSAADSESATEVPRAEDEWWRLLWVWRAAVVEDCKEVYKDHAATVIPALLSERTEQGRGARGMAGGRGASWGRETGIPKGAPRRVSIRERVVRGGWRGLRNAVPPTIRERLFQRYKWTYYRYFPERQVGGGR